MDRKDLLLEEASSQGELTPEEERKFRKATSDGGVFLEMTRCPGWTRLMDDYISKRISQERYLSAQTDDLADVRAGQKELFDLLNYVNSKIKEGEKSLKRLKNSQ